MFTVLCACWFVVVFVSLTGLYFGPIRTYLLCLCVCVYVTLTLSLSVFLLLLSVSIQYNLIEFVILDSERRCVCFSKETKTHHKKTERKLKRMEDIMYIILQKMSQWKSEDRGELMSARISVRLNSVCVCVFLLVLQWRNQMKEW